MVNMLVTLAVLAFIIFLNTKKSKEKYTLSTTNFYKGICAILVIISHILYKGYFLGPIAVGLFFFMSSYGLKFIYNEGKRITLNKLIKIYIPFLLVDIVYMILNKVNDLKSIILSLVSTRVVSYSWFIFEIIFLYIVFKIVYESKIKKKDFLMCFIIILSIVVMYLLNFSSWWYISTSGYMLGIIFYNIKNKDLKINNYLFIAMCAIISIMIMLYIYAINLRSGSKFGILVTVLVFFIVINYALVFLNHKSQNKIIELIGTQSLSMYLFHPLVIKLINIDNEIICLIMTLIITLIMSIVYNYIYIKIIKLIQSKIKPKES